jgi:inner membrane protein
VAPDLDLLVANHRTVTHSVTSAVVVGIVAALVMRSLGRPALRGGILFGLVWGGHLVLDWMGHDSSAPYGIMALWPFSDRWFISNLDVFSDVSRRYWLPRSFWLGNLASVAREVGPVAAAAWWLARRAERRPGV